MSRSTISTFQLFERFPNQEAARVYLEGRLWPDGVRCPWCKGSERITTRKDGFYSCNPCGKAKFTVRTGTIFERSHIPLHKWVYAMYLVVTARKGISSMQLAIESGTRRGWQDCRSRNARAGRQLGTLQQALFDNIEIGRSTPTITPAGSLRSVEGCYAPSG